MNQKTKEDELYREIERVCRAGDVPRRLITPNLCEEVAQAILRTCEDDPQKVCAQYAEPHVIVDFECAKTKKEFSIRYLKPGKLFVTEWL